MANLDPYRPPAEPIDGPAPAPAVANCPKCGFNVATKVRYNWWGGALGPKLFHVVKCANCRSQYNGRTGARLTGVIIGYQIVVIIVLIGAWFAWRA